MAEPKKVKVRTTMRPDEDVEVDAAELTDLHRQGLLVTDNRETRKIVEDKA